MIHTHTGLLGNYSQPTGKKIGIIVYMKRVYDNGYRRIHLKYVFQTILYTWNGILQLSGITITKVPP